MIVASWFPKDTQDMHRSRSNYLMAGLAGILAYLLFCLSTLTQSGQQSGIIGKPFLIFAILLVLGALMLEFYQNSQIQVVPPVQPRIPYPSKGQISQGKAPSAPVNQATMFKPQSMNSFSPVTQQAPARKLFDRDSIMRGDSQTVSYQPTLDYTTAQHLKRLQIDHLFEKWAANAQIWFSKTLIPTVMQAHRENLAEIDSILNKINGNTRDPVVFARSEDQRLLRQISKRVGLGDLFRFHESISEMTFDHFGPEDRQRFHNALCMRSILDGYFTLPENRQSDPEYVIERMYTALRERQTLRCVHQHESVYPSDAQIIAHWIFTCINNANNLDAMPNFDITDQFVVRFPEKLEPRAGWAFVQSSAEPFYELLVEGEILKLPKGDMHMFGAFALWLHWVRTQHAGVWQCFDCRPIIKQIVPLFQHNF